MGVSGQYTDTLPGGRGGSAPFTAGTNCTGDSVGSRAGLDGSGKSNPTGIWSPDRLVSRYSDWAISAHISI